MLRTYNFYAVFMLCGAAANRRRASFIQKEYVASENNPAGDYVSYRKR